MQNQKIYPNVKKVLKYFVMSEITPIFVVLERGCINFQFFNKYYTNYKNKKLNCAD